MPDPLTDRIAAATQVVKERGEAYGHPSDDFARASAIEAVVMQCPDPELRHVLLLLGTKLARLVHSPQHEDSWIDIAGYALTAGMVIDRRREGKPSARDIYGGRIITHNKTEDPYK